MCKFLLQIVLFLTCFAFGQQTYVDYGTNIDEPLTIEEKAKFSEVFGDGAKYVLERPSLLKNLKDLVRNRMTVHEIPFEKASKASIYANATDLSQIPLYDIFNPYISRDLTYRHQDFNILKYRIDFFPSKATIYKLGDYYITILPQKRKDR